MDNYIFLVPFKDFYVELKINIFYIIILILNVET